MKNLKLILFTSLVLAGDFCLAQTVSTNSILVGYDKHTTIQLSKEDVKSLDNVKSRINKCEVISYKLSLSSSGKKTSVIVQGDSIPSAAIGNVQSGDKISIEEVKAKCGKEPAKSIKGVTIEIK